MFIVLHNDGQYCYNSTKVVGIFHDYELAIYNASVSLVDSLCKPWLVKHYKMGSKYNGVPDYWIEEWDVSKNLYIQKYTLGYKCVDNKTENILNTFLKENSINYNHIVSSWKVQLDNKVIPEKLKTFINSSI